ncbi:MAG: ribosome biogenesis GTPase Der [Zetaproteobacteria bacterium]|nr:MAG: ribosome biogenesis GTPase Der [Zetaproteobacteria bacterium]
MEQDTRHNLPVVAIVGRPNVGKSTLFNRLVGQRKAIVGDRPGVTVDRLEARCRIEDRLMMLVDTGGIGETAHHGMQSAIDAQVEAALAVADLVLFVVDGQIGLTEVDRLIADKLRRQGVPVMLVVNKAEREDVAYDFYPLGLGDPLPVSAMHGQGMRAFRARLADALPAAVPMRDADEEQPLASITVIGRPNVGKSTLINAWLGKDRMVVSPLAGTTRDAIDSILPYGDGVIRLVDTAGQRKQGRIRDVIEFVARVKAVQAFRRADVAVMLVDGVEGVTEQDMRLMQLALEEGCALLVAINKLDLLDREALAHVLDRLAFRMRGMSDIPVFRIAAKQGRGVRRLLSEAVRAAERNRFQVATGPLNRWLQDAQAAQHPPSQDGAVVRLKYASQIATSPPTLKLFCNRPKAIRESYRRYLEQSFRRAFGLPGVPIRLIFTAGHNPYVQGDRKG